MSKLLALEKTNQLSDSDMKPLTKSDDLSFINNYTGKAQQNTTKINPHLCPNQENQPLIIFLHYGDKVVDLHNLKVVLIFVDFRKAFDSIHCGRFLRICAYN